MLLMIDNYDSFTYNLVQYFGELGADIRVFRNDEITLDEIAAMAPAQIVISPGPCTPHEAGISVPLIKEFAGKIPILGVCLGHQSIGEAFGGKIIRAKRVMHDACSTERAPEENRGPPVQRKPAPLMTSVRRFLQGCVMSRSGTLSPFTSPVQSDQASRPKS